MVIAGAGTGKTTVIIERVRHLLSAPPDPVPPESILVLTYNVRAAAELIERFERALGVEVASRLWVQNFHSFGQRVLQANRAEARLPDRTEVLDAIGQRLLLLALRPRLDLLYYALGAEAGGSLGHLAELINRARDELVTPEEYRSHAERRRAEFDTTFGPQGYAEAVASLRRRGALWQVREVRKAGLNGDAARIAGREARRTAGGTGRAVSEGELNPEQTAQLPELTASFLRDAAAFEVLRLEEEAAVFGAYVQELHDRGALDFGEQIQRVIALFRERPNVLRRYQRQFRHVLVDEFQDANVAQIVLLEMLGRAPDRPDNVVVVGDDDQSIYRFRGASYAAFDQFRERFGRAPVWDPARQTGPVREWHLVMNRRSTGRILAAATRLIEHNPRRLKAQRRLEATGPAGDPVRLIIASDETDEADAIAEAIRSSFSGLPEWSTRADGTVRARRWSDVAVLYRKHRHREPIVERLRRAGIPFTVVGGTGLFAQPDVRDLEAALRVAANPGDSTAFVRLLSAGPWRFDATEILRLTRAAAFDGRPVFEVAADVLRKGELLAEVSEPPVDLDGDREATAVDEPLTLWSVADAGTGSEGTVARAGERHGAPARARRREGLDTALRVKLQRLLDCLRGVEERANRDGPFDVLNDYLVRTDILHDLIAVGTPEAQSSVLAVARFLRFAADWQRSHAGASLADFITYLDMYQSVGGDLDAEGTGQGDVDGVHLMTVYQAKGLEYEIVVVPRLVERQFPDERSEQLLIPVELLRQLPPEDFEVAEERRLCYVAMTRARRHLILTSIEGTSGRLRPSRFVGEIAPDASAPTETLPGAVDPGSAAAFVGAGGDPEVADAVVTRRAPAVEEAPVSVPGGVPASDLAPDGAAAEAGARRTDLLVRLMPPPAGFERRFALRRRAVELIGALEQLAPDDHEGRDRVLDELIAVATDAAHAAEEARANGLDPLTLTVLSRHAPAGEVLLELASLPPAFSHSQFALYRDCPLKYAFQHVYQVPVPEEERRAYFEFGAVVHDAFETFSRARRDALAAGEPPPDESDLRRIFDERWQPEALGDAQTAASYRRRSEPILRAFYQRQLRSLAEALLFEQGFTVDLDGDGAEPPIRVRGFIDRLDRHPDGSIELIDYKTGRAKSQLDVDRDPQLTLYALAVREGAIRDPATGGPLPTPSRLTLYFTETDQWLTTARTDEQLDRARDELVALGRRIRSGDFTATPDPWRCGRCEYRRMCPDRAE